MPDPVTPLMKKDDFIKRTAVLARKRSPQLEQIDKLLGEIETGRHLGMGGDIAALKRAFHAWKMKEGLKWRESARNKQGAMEELEFQLEGGKAPATVLEKDAASARVGLLYLFANTTADSQKWKFLAKSGIDLLSDTLDLDPISDRMEGKIGKVGNKAVGLTLTGAKHIVPELLPSGQNSASTPPPGASQDVRTLWARISEYLTDLAKKIFNLVVDKAQQTMLNMRARFSGGAGSNAYEALNMLWDPVSNMVNSIVGKVAKAAAPLVGGIIKTIGGLKTLCEAIYQRYRSYSAGKDVNLNDGHPAVIANAINRAMNINVGKGVYETLKGAGSIGMAAASFGASAIVDLVIAGAELIIGFIHRIVEIAQINAFCTDCKERYAMHQEPSGIHNAPRIFGYWFSAAAMTTPAIAALALTSGITGDKMQYLKMFSDDGNVITQASFDRGVQFVDQLKSWSQDYLAETGYRFFSQDKMIASRLTAATNTDFKPLTVLTGWQAGLVQKSKEPVSLPSSITIGQRRSA